MENVHKPTRLERIRQNLHVMEVIEFSGLVVLLSLLFGLAVLTTESTEEAGLALLGLGTMMCGVWFALLFVWGAYGFHIRLARVAGLWLDILLWIVLFIVTGGISLVIWSILDVNRLILTKLLYLGEAPVEYAWSPGSKQHRKEWELWREMASVQQLADDQSVESLVALLRNKQTITRETAAGALGQLGDPQATGPLIVALKDRQISVREAAATALGQLGDTRAVEPLITALRYKKGEWAIQTIMPQLPIKVAAATALGQLGDVRAVEPLIATLQNKGVPLSAKGFTAPVRASAAAALGQLGDARATESLKAALQDNHEEVRAEAAAALEQLDPNLVTKPAPQEDPVQMLKEFKESLDAGLITAQEYEAKKADILSKM